MSEASIEVESPLGRLRLVAGDEALLGVWFAGRGGPAPRAPAGGHPVLEEARRQLRAYFSGRRRAFDLPLELRGTPFQREVWEALRAIPFGETRSYGQLARDLGHPSAMRAVGAANGRNPISIVVPCHRVIGADGSLTGYGGGIERKRWLLEHERRLAA